MNQYTPNRRRTLEVVGIVVLIAVLVPFAVFIVPQVVGAEHSYAVLSSSMSPTISAGDAVIVNGISAAAVSEGDIITFRQGKTAEIRQGQAGANLVTHRVVNVVQNEDGLQFETKGDANEEADRKLVPAAALVGRVAFTIPYIGHVIAFAGTQMGFLALVALPLGLLVLGELYDLARAARTGRDASDGPTEPDADAEPDGGSIPDETATGDEPTGGNDAEDD
ncbi:signal peptidase I [Halococcus dombrowskii]|uniref:Signal peptidase I n=1 Tax=Halococcus dombrowskii TaxID=179637 RepID=A0AAX3AKM4_HALDO|nr:signal peptidase I [Halococcus dombrowskii]UOO94654.1 signal peptidase I [Halococcus dombrowskii]